jgi:signal transduction histidine kinase/CheY-like chemotaxis protein
MESYDKTKSASRLGERRRATPVPDLGIDVLSEVMPALGMQVLVFDTDGALIHASDGVDATCVQEVSDRVTAELSAAPESSQRLTIEEFTHEVEGQPRTCALTAFHVNAHGERRLVVLARDNTLTADLRREIEILDRQATAGRVAAGVAHEFNNIITAMLGWSQIARRTATGDERSLKALDTLELSARRARQIASQLLDITRPAGLPDRCFAPDAPLEEALGLLAWELGEAGVDVIREIDATAPIRGDNTRLVQLFVNLIRNAMDALPGGGKLRISVSEERARIRIELADDGAGIAPEIAGRIFEPFFTTKPDRAERDTGGSGLGLAICRRIVEEHGGEISAGPSDLGGARVTVALPIAAQATRSLSDAPPSRSSFPPGVAVLVVDDDLDIREMISTALSLRGAEVAIAANGDEALELCRERRFDAAFVDYTMIGLSGHELGRALAEVQPALPIVFMSGREVVAAGNSHMTDYLKKPFDLHEIQRKLRQVLDHRPEGCGDTRTV